ncbi:MAG: hypothetical protein PHG19_03770 [Anaerotignum sp.]|nr:hypothetical protein [Anaerotignum sp.]
MNDNLISINKLKSDIKAMKLFSIFLKPDLKRQLKDMEKQLENMIAQTTAFNDRFSSHGWCAYDSMSFDLMESANAAFEKDGLEVAEQVLINYYKTDVSKIVHWIKHSSEAFAIRDNLIQCFFEDHFAERYYASVPLGLIIVDGAVNDFTKSKGLFAEGTAVDAWDCLVGCSNGLTKLKSIFNQKRTKTNSEAITLPYRNGILHGRDLNYANEYVSCKCVSLIFSVADWMKMKNSEEERKAKYEKSVNPPPIRESLARLNENKQIQDEISAWKKRTVVVDKDIPPFGTAEDYIEYPYIAEVVEMLSAWKSRNYGKLSIHLQKMFPSSLPVGKRAGECRKIFENKTFDAFEIIEIEERACALSKVIVKVLWTANNCNKEAVLTFGCVYESNTERVGVPWRNNGKWVLMPWDVRGLYQ